MDVITEFLSGINIWLAVVAVDFSVFFIVYGVIVCIKLVKDAIDPIVYTEKNDYFEEDQEDTYYYDLEDYTKTNERG